MEGWDPISPHADFKRGLAGQQASGSDLAHSEGKNSAPCGEPSRIKDMLLIPFAEKKRPSCGWAQ
jgi:hypothetical protein